MIILQFFIDIFHENKHCVVTMKNWRKILTSNTSTSLKITKLSTILNLQKTTRIKIKCQINLNFQNIQNKEIFYYLLLFFKYIFLNLMNIKVHT